MKKTKSRSRRKATRHKAAARHFLYQKLAIGAALAILALFVSSKLWLTHAGTKPTFVAADYKCTVGADNLPVQVLQLDSEGGCVDYYKTLLGQYQKGTSMGGDRLDEAQAEIGIFDSKTTRLTQKFQQTVNLALTGTVDKATWQALINACYQELKCEQ